jgi:hypothetical protein
MFPTHVALVPYEEGLVPTDELLYVASALQTQVTRDLGPLWDLAGVVSPFLRLEDVPPTYIPFAIVAGLPYPWHGFHVVSDGRPVALIGYRKGWSLLASHELMEILCDPWGNRRLPGPSLEDGQGHVEYLVEVCDPCQTEHYGINDIHVADFVTPDFYALPDGEGQRYSFTGRVQRPLEPLEGGVISWRTPNGQIWEKPGGREPHRLEGAGSKRGSMDPDEATPRPDITETLSKPHRSRKPYYRLAKSQQRYGEGLKVSIDRVLERLGVIPPKADVEAILSLLWDLAQDGHPARERFKTDPEGLLKEYGLDPPRNLGKLKLADPAAYRAILAAFQGGSGFGDPELLDWLSTHAVLAHAGIE